MKNGKSRYLNEPRIPIGKRVKNDQKNWSHPLFFGVVDIRLRSRHFANNNEHRG